MGAFAVVLGLGLMLLVLFDTIETVLLPRTVARRVGFTTIFYSGFGSLYSLVGRRLSPSNPHRERLLGAYGPLSLVALIVLWAFLLVFSFALVQWGLGTRLSGPEPKVFGVYLYNSAETFFTLGYGDVAPLDTRGRAIAATEAGVGFGFLALVIGYVPVLYGSFSRRESTILLFDARAGSPPTASELLGRYSRHGLDALEDFLKELERWSANLLESYLSYPLLAMYRSQHEKLTWLGAVAAMLDACALLRVTCESDKPGHARLLHQAELTYAMARHLVVDVAYILNIPPSPPAQTRLPRSMWPSLVAALDSEAMRLSDDLEVYQRLRMIRREYEPYLNGLSQALFLPLPPWMPERRDLDSWQLSAWDDSERHFQAAPDEE